MFLNLPLSLFSHLLGAGVEIGKLEMKPRNHVTACFFTLLRLK